MWSPCVMSGPMLHQLLFKVFAPWIWCSIVFGFAWWHGSFPGILKITCQLQTARFHPGSPKVQDRFWMVLKEWLAKS